MTVTTIYHYAPGLVAPYALRSLMVALGTFFVALPYGKFVHRIYRSQALLQFARASRAPNTAGIAEF